MGTNVWNSSMLSAVSQGLVKEATVDAAAYRAVLQRMRQGDFDPFVPVAPPAPACADPITPPEVNTDSRGTAVGDGAARLAAGAPAEACRKLCCATEGCDTYTYTLHQAARWPPCLLLARGAPLLSTASHRLPLAAGVLAPARVCRPPAPAVILPRGHSAAGSPSVLDEEPRLARQQHGVRAPQQTAVHLPGRARPAAARPGPARGRATVRAADLD